MVVKGDLKLEIDDQGLEVRVTLVPGDTGADLSLESVLGALAEKKVREGIDTEAIDKALRTIARKKGEAVTFVAAAGQQPRLAEPEGVDFEPLPVPARLSAASGPVLAQAKIGLVLSGFGVVLAFATAWILRVGKFSS